MEKTNELKTEDIGGGWLAAECPCGVLEIVFHTAREYLCRGNWVEGTLENEGHWSGCLKKHKIDPPT